MTSSTAPGAGAPEDRPGPKTKSRLIAAAAGLGGMVFGSLVGIAVQVGIESTGMLGPGLDALIAEQDANFTGIHARLDELQGATSDPEALRTIAELRSLIERQSELSAQAGTELHTLTERVSTMSEQQLAEQGFAGGADFWLDTGESVNVGSDSQVFGLIRYLGSNRPVDVNLSGTRKRMAIGDAMAVPDTGCTIFFKQATRRADGRIGFDISCG